MAVKRSRVHNGLFFTGAPASFAHQAPTIMVFGRLSKCCVVTRENGWRFPR